MRPKSIRRSLAAAAVAVTSAVALAGAVTPAAQAATACTHQDDNRPAQNARTTVDGRYKPEQWDSKAAVATICLINEARTARGLPELYFFWVSQPLVSNSIDHGRDLVLHGKVTPTDPHTGSNGSTPAQRMAAYGAGASYWRVNEIVAEPGNGTPTAAFDWWMNSPGHRAIILDRELTEMAVHVIGQAPGGGRGATYVVSFGVRR